MVWINIAFSAAISFVICAVYIHFWRRRIRRDTETEAIVGKLRKEVGELVTELNATTERNIALLEDRIAALGEMVDRAGKTTGVLRRESEKHDIASQVYTSLGRSRPAPGTLNLAVVEGTERDVERPGTESATVRDDARSAESDAYGTSKHADRDSGSPSDATGSELSGVGPEKHDGIVDFESMSIRDKAMFMHRNGETPESIADALGMSRGEVELVISLHDRRHR